MCDIFEARFAFSSPERIFLYVIAEKSALTPDKYSIYQKSRTKMYDNKIRETTEKHRISYSMQESSIALRLHADECRIST